MDDPQKEILDSLTRLHYELGRLSVSVEEIKANMDHGESYYRRGIENTRAVLDSMRGSSFTISEGEN